MISIQPSSLEHVSSFRRQYVESLGGRPDSFLEEIISSGANVFTIDYDHRIVGYFAVSSKQTLLQFYIEDSYLPQAQEIFGTLLRGGYISKALVLTRDRVALSLALDLSKEVIVDSLVFEEGPYMPAPELSLEYLEFRVASTGDVPAIRAACGDFHDFLHYTLEGSVAGGDIFVLTSGQVVLGTGVIGAKSIQYPYVDIGMCVNPDFRKRDVGTYMITKLRDECRKQGWIAGASCKYDNIGSKRTLEKAGMISKDRILRVVFN